MTKSTLKFFLASLILITASRSFAYAESYVDRYEEELTLKEPGTGANTIQVNRTTESWSNVIVGEIRDSLNRPTPKVAIVFQGKEWATDESGRFSIPVAQPSADPILIKKPGYRKISISPQSAYITAMLEPVEIKSLYMQSGHLKNRSAIFKSAMALIQDTELNALTIDVKDDDGRISTGFKPYIDELHAQGVYAIARIVTFKDNIGPRKHPEMAIMNGQTGKPWEDKKGMTYLNPYNSQAWEYVIQAAKGAVAAGFDEIQFDYVRFPTDGNRTTIAWSSNSTGVEVATKFDSQTRSQAIAGFLQKARHELGAMGTFVAADVFGITAFDTNDSGIGQRIEAVAPFLDYVCPMVYPSGYSDGSGGIRNPVDQPGAIVEISIKRYRVRAEKVNSELVIRPWLQSFRDYSKPSHRNYTGDDIRAQIDGSDRAGGSGFLLWNAASKYSKAGLKEKKKNTRVLP